MKATQFRCPFEMKGIEDRTIIEVALTEDKQERLDAMVRAIIQFRSRPETIAIRFVLPRSVLSGCDNNRVLRHMILPYQSEMIAAQLDVRLRPFLSYHHTDMGMERAKTIWLTDRRRAHAALALHEYIKASGIPAPRSIAEQSVWLETVFGMAMTKALILHPSIKISMPVQGQMVMVMTMSPATITVHEDHLHSGDAAFNQNFFSIVRTPFYPEATGRFGSEVDIVMTREADFVALLPHVRRRIRTQSNEVYREHGIRIGDIAEEHIAGGLWQPEYEVTDS